MKKSVLGLTAAATFAAAAATGCSSSGTNSPDEFRVVRKAPLSVPPEYNLRPPAAGASIPVELQKDDEARAILFGQSSFGAEASEGERMLVQKAGAEAIDPNIRSQVDFDATGTLRKSSSLTDKILFFKGDEKATIIDPENEEARIDQEFIDNATGGGSVVIERRNGDSKLPGL